ncbi:MAG: response regulator [Acidimicrobiales bacterium]
MSTPVRVMVVDDHPVVREGLRGMLSGEQDIDVVGEASSGPGAVSLASDLVPDVVLMDLRMPGGGGLEATRQLASGPGHGRRPRVIVLTTYDTDQDILRAVEAGAAGYMLKDAPRSELVAAIRAAARGESVLAGPVAARLAAAIRAPRSEDLTARELEVLGEVAKGRTNAEAGQALFIGEATVKTHLLRVFAKLGVDDRTAAVTVAMARGLLPNPGES